MRRALNLIPIAIVLAFVLAAALILPAFSAEAVPAPAPDWPSLTNSLIELLGAILAAGLTALVKRIWDWLGLKNDDVRRAYVLSALNNGASAAIAKAKGFAAAHDDEAVQYVVEYMNTHVPDGMKKLGIDADKLLALAGSAVERAMAKPPPGTTEGVTVTQPAKQP